MKWLWWPFGMVIGSILMIRLQAFIARQHWKIYLGPLLPPFVYRYHVVVPAEMRGINEWIATQRCLAVRGYPNINDLRKSRPWTLTVHFWSLRYATLFKLEML